MIYLMLCVLANVGIFLCFRLFKTYDLDTFQAIVFNYIFCVVTGVIFTPDLPFELTFDVGSPWVLIAMVLGLVFIGTFYLMALTTQRFSMTVSSIASKMSLIIPVLVSLLVLQVYSKDYTLLNYLGMAVAFPAILLSSLKSRMADSVTSSRRMMILPIGVFLFGGLIDMSINYTNFKYLNTQTEALFPIVIFASAAVIGIFTMIAQRSKPEPKNLIGGVVLGGINYFSIFFLIKALSYFNNDGALVYPLLNVGIIVLSAILSVTVFKERLSKINLTGILLAVLSIALLSYQELTQL